MERNQDRTINTIAAGESLLLQTIGVASIVSSHKENNMKKSRGRKSIHVQVDVELHDVLSKLSIDTGHSATSIIVQYLKYLQSMHYKNRRVLNEKSTTDFKLDETVTR